jgi:inosine-uridine nucleoside N-ribohydrolase
MDRSGEGEREHIEYRRNYTVFRGFGGIKIMAGSRRLPSGIAVVSSACALVLSGIGSSPGAAEPAHHHAAAPAPMPLIIDTDIFGDADDAGALAIANALQDNGNVKVLGVMVDTTSRWGAPAVDAINTYYGHGNIPVGTRKPNDDSTSRSNYAQYLAQNFPNAMKDGTKAADAVGLYRKLLASQPDHSVVIAAIGPATNLANLLNSAPDEFSPLIGSELVANKVTLMSMMGGQYPSGFEFNFYDDPKAAARVVHDWPTRMVFSGYEVGEHIKTGSALTGTSTANPVRKAYEIYAGTGNNISSWDPTAVYFAGLGTNGVFNLSAAGSNRIASDGANQWQSSPVKDQQHLVNAASVDTIAKSLHTLMTQTPRPPAG